MAMKDSRINRTTLSGSHSFKPAALPVVADALARREPCWGLLLLLPVWASSAEFVANLADVGHRFTF